PGGQATERLRMRIKGHGLPMDRPAVAFFYALKAVRSTRKRTPYTVALPAHLRRLILLHRGADGRSLSRHLAIRCRLCETAFAVIVSLLINALPSSGEVFRFGNPYRFFVWRPVAQFGVK